MPKPSSIEKAAALSKKTGGLFVFATIDHSLVERENASAEIAKYSFAEFACGGCGGHFHHPKADGLQPHCIVCGHDDTKLIAASKPSVPRDSELSFLTCNSCGADNTFHQDLATACSKMHCVVCGTTLLASDMDLLTEPSPAPEADDMELVDIDDSIDVVAETTQDPASDNVGKPLTPDAVAPSTTTQDAPSDKPSGEVPADPVNPGTTLQDPIAPKQVTAEDEEIEVDFTEDLDLDDSSELSFLATGDTLCLMAKNQIIATLSEVDAGDNKDMLQTSQLRQAIAHTIQSQGLQKAIAHYGFKPVKMKIGLAKVLSKKIEARVAESAKVLATARDEVFQEVNQSLDIAAAGFATNFWRNKADPLKQALAAELRAVGVRNPQTLIDRVYANHAVASIHQVVELARELITKPVEARNGLAQAIDLARYQPMVVKASDDSDADDADEDNEDDEDSEEALVTVATPVHESVTASARPSVYRDKALASILGSESLPFAQF